MARARDARTGRGACAHAAVAATQPRTEAPVQRTPTPSAKYATELLQHSAKEDPRKAFKLLHVLAASKLQVSSFHFGALLGPCERRSAWVLALCVLAETDSAGVETNIVAWNAVQSSLAKKSQWLSALRMLQMAVYVSQQLDSISFDTALSSCRCQRWKQALAVVSSARTQSAACAAWAHIATGIRPGPSSIAVSKSKSQALVSDFGHNFAMTATGNALRWQRALEVLWTMTDRKVETGAYSLNEAINVCKASSCWQVALGLLSSVEGAVPDLISFGSALSACARASAWEEALGLLSALPQQVVKPNHICYNSALAALQLAAEWKHAAALLRHMTEASLANVVAYNAALGALGAAKHWAESLEVLPEMASRRFNANDVSMSTILNTLGGDGKWQAALQLASYLAQLETATLSATSLRSVLRRQRWRSALEAAPEDEVDASVAIGALGDAGHWAEAMRCAVEAPWAPAPSLISTNTAAALGGPAVQQGLALQVATWAHAVQPTLTVDRAVLAAASWTTACSALETMPEPCDGPSVSAIITSVGFLRWQLGLSLLGELLALRPAADRVAFGAALAACAKIQEWTQCLSLLQHMRCQRIAPDGVAYNAVLLATSRGECWPVVLDLLRVMAEEAVIPDVTSHSCAAEALERAGRPFQVQQSVMAVSQTISALEQLP
eukprot:s1853_g6.t4